MIGTVVMTGRADLTDLSVLLAGWVGVCLLVWSVPVWFGWLRAGRKFAAGRGRHSARLAPSPRHRSPGRQGAFPPNAGSAVRGPVRAGRAPGALRAARSPDGAVALPLTRAVGASSGRDVAAYVPAAEGARGGLVPSHSGSCVVAGPSGVRLPERSSSAAPPDHLPPVVDGDAQLATAGFAPGGVIPPAPPGALLLPTAVGDGDTGSPPGRVALARESEATPASRAKIAHPCAEPVPVQGGDQPEPLRGSAGPASPSVPLPRHRGEATTQAQRAAASAVDVGVEARGALASAGQGRAWPAVGPALSPSCAGSTAAKPPIPQAGQAHELQSRPDRPVAPAIPYLTKGDS